MKKLINLRNFLIALPVLVLLAGLHYALPQVDLVRAVGVEIKRVDIGENESGQQRTRDVYQLQMETPDGQPRVYRNEDNFAYGKLDSANLQAQIQSLATDKQLVALRHYGWRLTWFSAFPNAISAWPVEDGYRHIPLFNILVLVGLGSIAFLVFRRIRRVSENRTESRRLREVERAERKAASRREAEFASQRSRDAKQRNQSDIDDFLNSGGGN